MRILSWVRSIVLRRRTEREMQEEMRMHLEQATVRMMDRGLDREDATAAARREFGNLGVIQEDARDVQRAPWLEALIADVRFALRHFRRTPLTTATIVLVLSLGLGTNSALFDFGQAFLFKPPVGVSNDPRLVRVDGTTERDRLEGRYLPRELSWNEYQAVRDQREVFSSVAGWSSVPVTLKTGASQEAAAAIAEFVTPELISLLGGRIALGHGLPANDDIGQPVAQAVLSHQLWVTQFGGDANVVGRTFQANGMTMQVVGVVAGPFRGLDDFGGQDQLFWAPFSARAAMLTTGTLPFSHPDSGMISVVARLAPEVSRGQAGAAIHALGVRTGALMTQVKSVKSRGMRLDRLSQLTALVSDGDFPIIVGVFGGGSLLILLIVCTNVIALMLGAGVARQQEIAVRLSLGASRGRIVRQLLTESIILSLCAAGMGILIYVAALGLFRSQVDNRLDLGWDLTTIAFTIGFAMITGVLFGLSPALHATRSGTGPILKGSGGVSPARTRLQRSVLVAQIALTQPLLVGLGLMILMMGKHWTSPERADASRHAVQVRFPMSEGDREIRKAKIHTAMERVAASPGVSRVVYEPAGYRNYDVHPAGEDAATPQRVEARGVGPGYLEIMGFTLVRGRDFAPQDSLLGDSPVIIGEDFAHHLFGDRDPIGQRLDLGWEGKNADANATIIGVTRQHHPSGRSDRWGILSLNLSSPGMGYLIGTRGLGSEALPGMRAVLRDASPDLPFALRTLEEVEAERRADFVRVSAATAGGGLLALGLSAIGLYGIIALLVGQRRREIGIRMAIGAKPGQVVYLLLRSGLQLGGLGLLLGLPLSLAAVRLLVSQVDAPNIRALPLGIAIAATVMAVAGIASWIPARRAGKVDPMRALRAE